MYGSIEAWRSWATARGNEAPTEASDADASAALVRASDYIRARYVSNLLPGYDVDLQPEGYDQPIVAVAAYIAAGLELGAPGFFSRTYTPAQQKVLSQVEGIRWTVTGDSSKTYAAMPVSTLIEAMFEPYVRDRDAPQFLLRSVGP